MPCEVRITSVRGVLPAGGGTSAESIVVAGTARDCPSGQVELWIRCGGVPSSRRALAPIRSDGTWEHEEPTDIGVERMTCTCGGRIRVTATCYLLPEDESCDTDTYDGSLDCGQECADSVDLMFEPDPLPADACADPDSGRGVTITFTARVTPAGSAVDEYEWTFGDERPGDPPHTTPGPTTTHTYSEAGTYTATVLAHPPLGALCRARTDDVTVVIPRCPGVACPEVSGRVTVRLDDSEACADPVSGRTVWATLEASLTPPGATGRFLWDFGDGTPDGFTATPTVRHEYTRSSVAEPAGVFNVSVTFIPDDPDCDPSAATGSIAIPACASCPERVDLTATVEGCADPESGETATVTATATVSPAAPPGTEYHWNFGDGTPEETSATPTHDHEYGEPGPRIISVRVTAPGCDPVEWKTEVDVPACDRESPGDGDGGGRDGGSSECGSLLFIVAALVAAAATGTIIAIAATTCPLIASSTTVSSTLIWGIVAGLWIAAALAVVLWLILCALDICPCPTACDWLVIAWMAVLAMALVATYLSTCCPGWIFVAVGLGLAAAAAFAAWLAACKPGACQVLDYLLVTVVTVTATTIGYIALIPAIAACGSVAAAVAITTAGAILGIAVPVCHDLSD